MMYIVGISLRRTTAVLCHALLDALGLAGQPGEDHRDGGDQVEHGVLREGLEGEHRHALEEASQKPSIIAL